MRCEMMPRVRTGIPGFDEMSFGGLPKGRVTLISGTTGAGKTIFASMFVYNGVVKFNDSCVFVSFEERPEDIIRNMKGIGIVLASLIKKGKLVFVDASRQIGIQEEASPYNLDALIE